MRARQLSAPRSSALRRLPPRARLVTAMRWSPAAQTPSSVTTCGWRSRASSPASVLNSLSPCVGTTSHLKEQVPSGNTWVWQLRQQRQQRHLHTGSFACLQGQLLFQAFQASLSRDFCGPFLLTTLSKGSPAQRKHFKTQSCSLLAVTACLQPVPVQALDCDWRAVRQAPCIHVTKASAANHVAGAPAAGRRLQLLK